VNNKREISTGKVALVVDDSKTQCKVLSILLQEEGYHVFTANDGAQGVDKYIKYHPDLILMDINMPVMDGFEAARKIKSLSQGDLTPLIFITSMNTDESFIECVDAGGDGILVRPFSPDVFKAKIKSIQRISDLHRQVKQLQQEQQNDAQLAEKLLSDVIESRNYGLDRISIIKQAAALFSGDIQLTALCPNGDINILLGDFTGHGLRASIGAIPVTETFRAMTKKGFFLFDIVSQINAQLYQLLPPDLFLAATFVCISSHEKSAYVFNAGLPDSYIFDEQAKIKHQLASVHPPLGVMPELLPDTRLTIVPVEEGDRAVLISDGIVEARDLQGKMYGTERFELVARQGILNKSLSETVMQDVNVFCQGAVQDDDISLFDIPCGGWVDNRSISQDTSESYAEYGNEYYDFSPPVWTWALHLKGQRLAKVNPVPLAMSQINDLEGSGEHWQSLFTVLTELYVNALDHGVLGLSSELKSSPEGFAQYYNERENRLKALDYGYVDISLSYHLLDKGGKMVIRLKDSGQGFDIYKLLKSLGEHSSQKNYALSGRGVELVNRLCDTIEYKENGTLVEVTYIWNTKEN